MAAQFFGQYLLARGLVSSEQLLTAVDYQDDANLRLGDYAVNKGYLSLDDANRIHRVQTTRDVQFGTAAVELGLLRDDQIEGLLREQRADHLYLGAVIVKLGFMSDAAVATALAQYQREQRQHAVETLRIPPELPIAPLATEIFDLTRKLLLRLWGLQSKYGALRLDEKQIHLGPIAVEAALAGDIAVRYLFGASEAAAARALHRLFGAESPALSDLTDLAGELASGVVTNVAASRVSAHKQVSAQPARPVPSVVRVDGERALVVRLVTPLGDACVAVTY